MRPAFIGILVALVVTTAHAQRKTTFETLTVAGTAVGLASVTLSGMAACEGRVEGAAIRFRFDGVNPTAAVGAPVAIGDRLEIRHIEDAQRIRFIAQSGTATLSVWCWPQT